MLGLYAYIRGASRETHQIVALHILLLAGLAVYSFGILCVYLWHFGAYEAVRVASFERYLGTYWIGWSFILCATYVHHWRKDVVTEASKQKAFAAVLTVTVLLMFLAVPLSIGFCKSRFFPPELIPIRKTIRQAVADIVDQVVPPNAKLYLIWQQSNGYHYFLLKYELATHFVNGGAWSLGEPYDASDVWTSQLTPEAWSDVLCREHYDFVVIANADEKFWKKYGMLFKDIEANKNNLIFKIIPSSDKTVQLLPVRTCADPGNLMRNGTIKTIEQGSADWSGWSVARVNDGGVDNAYGYTGSDAEVLNNDRGLTLTFNRSVALTTLVHWSYGNLTFNYVIEYYTGGAWATVATIACPTGTPTVISFNADQSKSSTQWRWYISDWNNPETNFYAFELGVYESIQAYQAYSECINFFNTARKIE